ncbi:MAG: hypothetical protein K0Q52_1532 [Microbacterium sp.]|jgi:hypothetical protein|nr:hypothetical protein [Microbacterium sp.]
MPLTPPTLTLLDPSAPLLWRDEHTLQLGDDDALLIDADAAWVELLLSRLRTGFRRGSFDMIAHTAGAPRDAARALLARLEPVLLDEAAAPRPAWVESIGIDDGRTEYRIREALIDEGVPLVDHGRRPGVGVVLVRGAAAALQFAHHLREDTPHLPVSFEPGRVTIGPLVTPGASACLACRDAHATDHDPAWPLLHTQMIGRDPGPIRAAQVAEAGRLAALLLAADGSTDGRMVRVSADGSRVWHSVTFHEECRCRGPLSPSQQGTSTEHVPPVLPISTRTGTAFARRA